MMLSVPSHSQFSSIAIYIYFIFAKMQSLFFYLSCFFAVCISKIYLLHLCFLFHSPKNTFGVFFQDLDDVYDPLRRWRDMEKRQLANLQKRTAWFMAVDGE